MLIPTRGFASAGGCEIGATVLFCLFVCLFVEDGSGECCVSFLSARIAVEMDQSSCIWMYVFFFFFLLFFFFFFYSFCA
jgi:hypothetical protein